MVFYARSSDSNVQVVDSKGNLQTVTQRAYNVIHRNQGYKLASEVKPSTTKKKRVKKEDVGD